MKKWLAFFRKSWLISLLGVLAIAWLIWFVGPLLAIAGREPLVPEINRLLLILVVLVLWGLNQLRKYLRDRRKNKQVLEGLASAPSDPIKSASAEEIAELKARFEEAVKVLKKVRLDRRQGHQHVYQLPWYIIIGPPGSGKTTALVNSGLHFPLAERFGNKEIRGVGGTRNCDWFFTDEAVLLDTAGRYATQDSHQEVDKAAWSGFLDLLKKHRRRRPINGILVAISLAELLQQNESQRTQQAQAIKQRIQELHQHLGVRFPIYVLFTKCDLLAGFLEFFNDLGREERSQVWGMTFPMDDLESPQGAVENFPSEFDALEERLNVRLVERLQQERDSWKRDLIYGFPHQFSSLKDVAKHFLVEVFRPSVYEERGLLRGVYFTSGTQEGTPIDRLIGSLAATYRVDQQAGLPFSGTGKSYFITRLLRDVIFRESGLAGTNLRLERNRAWLQRGAYAGILIVTVLLGAAWFTSYMRNQHYVAEVDKQVQQLEAQIDDLSPDQRDLLSVLPLLNKARRLPGGYQDKDTGTPLLMGLGLYQGDKLGEQAAITAYRRLLNTVFLPRLMLRLEEQLRQGSANPDYHYEALKVYLMLNEPSHFDPQTVKAWMTLDWEQRLSRRATREQRQELQTHLDALLENFPTPLPFAQNTELIQQVRDQLVQLSPAQRIYARLKGEQLNTSVPDFRISEAAGRDAPLVFTRQSGKPLSAGVPGFFTYAGYHDVFLPQSLEQIETLADESWILGEQFQLSTDPEELQYLSAEVHRLYLEDYAHHWEELLADIEIRPLSNLSEAVIVLNVLSAPDSPLEKLLAAVTNETSLERPPTEDEANQQHSASDKITKRVTSRVASKVPGVSKLRRLLGYYSDATDSEATPVAELPNDVKQRFADLHRLVQDQGLANIQSLLNELFIYLNAITSAPDQGSAALDAIRQQAGSIINKLKLEAQRQPAPLDDWLQSLAEDSHSLTLGGVQAHLNTVWTAEILSFCRKGLSNRYPLEPSSPRDVTLADFAQFFGPGGLMEKFFQDYLQSFVDISRNPWQWRDKSGKDAGVSTAALVQFQRADAIRKAFFQGNSQLPSVRFTLKPITMDPGANQFLLDLDGQQVTYSHGPTRPSTLQWPGPDGANQVQIRFSPPSLGGRSGLTVEGPWAWFRLLDQSDVEPTQDPERFAVTFRVDGREARYELRASSAFNPFGLKALERFRCPQRL